MSWNWSIFVFTRIYNCLITSSSNRLTISGPLIGLFHPSPASDWPMSGPDHPGESRKQCHRVQCPGFIIAAAAGIWAASVTRAIGYRDEVLFESISNRKRIDSTADNSRWLHPKWELCSHCCWCWQWMRKRWCWRCWCDDEMRRDDLTAADGSRPVWDDILMWYPHIIQTHRLIMKM